MKSALRIGAVVLVVVVLIGAGAVFLRQRAQSTQGVAVLPTAAVTRGSVEELVSATGNVLAEREATLAFRTSGPIAEVLVEVGQPVQAGQVLARLEPSSLEWQVARARTSLGTAQARLEQARQAPTAEDLASAQAALDSARANYEKVEAGPTAEELASARSALDSARSNLDRVEAGPTTEELASAKAALDNAQAALRQAQAAYDRVSWRPDVGLMQESLTLQNATTEMERAQANYDGLVARPTASDLAAAKAQVAQAEAQLAQLKDRPSASDLSAAQSQVAQAEAQLAQLEQGNQPADLAVYAAQVEEAQVALAQAEAQMDDALIIAPFAGTALEVQARPGEWAAPGAPAIVLAASDPLILAANVDEVDVPQLAVGQAARLSFNAINGQEIQGIVRRIAPASSNVNGAVAYGVEIGFSPGDVPVRLGMTANVDIVVASAQDALLVPNRAITADREAGRYYVTRQLGEGTSEQAEVKIGLRGDSYTEIREGLREGDEVVLPEVPAQGAEEQGGRFGGGPFGRPQQSGGGQ